MLENFKAYLQRDGYIGYLKYAKQKGLTHLACCTYSRREYERALDKKALLMIQKLYTIERLAN